MLLQTRGRLTADQLAATFEVSVRTVYRDIEQLSAAGVPVYADRGPGGGFQLLDGFRTKLTGLTEHEAETLFLSGLPGPATQLGLADQLLSAQLKLTAALPERSRLGAQKIAQRFHLDPVDWFKSPDQRVCSRLWRTRCGPRPPSRSPIAGPRARSTRRLSPLGLVLKAGTRYVVADPPASCARIVSNIQALAATEDWFTRPKDFDLVRFWTESSRAYEVGLLSLRGRAARLRRARSGVWSGWARPWPMQPASQPSRRTRTAGCRSPCRSRSIEQAAIDLLHLGTEAEVLKPKELRRRLAATAREMAKINS